MSLADQASRPRVALAMATMFGLGYMRFAPGTWGSAIGLGIWLLLPASIIAQVAAIALTIGVGWWAGSVAERHFGRTDPGPVVIDEVAGMMITLFLNPVGWAGALVGFLLFRLADVIKPYPANRFERLHGGLGVMADDVMAAVYANLVLRGLIAFTGDRLT